jgi:rSAM/selenodomain-associated transferase 1
MSLSAASDTLLIFVKTPRPGAVKTRLGKTLGHENAVVVYQKLLAHTAKVVKPLPVEKVVWYGNQPPHSDRWVAIAHQRKAQNPEASLGTRMAKAFKTAFDQGRQRVVIIGSDCPELSSALLEEAFTELKRHPVVIGPAADGGYYLLGMQKPYPLFENIDWSTDKVLRQTQAKTQELGLEAHLLPTLHDLDHEKDLAKFPAYDPSN